MRYNGYVLYVCYLPLVKCRITNIKLASQISPSISCAVIILMTLKYMLKTKYFCLMDGDFLAAHFAPNRCFMAMCVRTCDTIKNIPKTVRMVYILLQPFETYQCYNYIPFNIWHLY